MGKLWMQRKKLANDRHDRRVNENLRSECVLGMKR
jgi:hypothetical protein